MIVSVWQGELPFFSMHEVMLRQKCCCTVGCFTIQTMMCCEFWHWNHHVHRFKKTNQYIWLLDLRVDLHKVVNSTNNWPCPTYRCLLLEILERGQSWKPIWTFGCLNKFPQFSSVPPDSGFPIYHDFTTCFFVTKRADNRFSLCNLCYLLQMWPPGSTFFFRIISTSILIPVYEQLFFVCVWALHPVPISDWLHVSVIPIRFSRSTWPILSLKLKIMFFFVPTMPSYQQLVMFDNWLVVEPLLRKILVIGMIIPKIWESKYVLTHQPDSDI